MFFYAAAVDAEITQLSAVHGEDEFNMYILPGKPISLAASRDTPYNEQGQALPQGEANESCGVERGSGELHQLASRYEGRDPLCTQWKSF